MQKIMYSVLCLLCFFTASSTAEELVEIEYSFKSDHRANTFFIDYLSGEIASRSQGEIALVGKSAVDSPGVLWDRLVSGEVKLAFGSQVDAPHFFPRTLLSGLGGSLEEPFDLVERLWYESQGSLSIEYEKVKLMALCVSSSAGLVATKSVESLQDLAGMRISPYNNFASPIISALGATPVLVSDSDIANALFEHRIDAAVVDLAQLESIARQGKGKLFFSSNFPVQARPYFVAMNGPYYEQLPEKGKTAVSSLTEVDVWMNCTQTFADSDERLERDGIESGAVSYSVISESERNKIDAVSQDGLMTIFGNIRAQGVYEHEKIYRALSVR